MHEVVRPEPPQMSRRVELKPVLCEESGYDPAGVRDDECKHSAWCEALSYALKDADWITQVLEDV
jgi:hypothetical protein